MKTKTNYGYTLIQTGTSRRSDGSNNWSLLRLVGGVLDPCDCPFQRWLSYKCCRSSSCALCTTCRETLVVQALAVLCKVSQPNYTLNVKKGSIACKFIKCLYGGSVYRCNCSAAKELDNGSQKRTAWHVFVLRPAVWRIRPIAGTHPSKRRWRRGWRKRATGGPAGWAKLPVLSGKVARRSGGASVYPWRQKTVRCCGRGASGGRSVISFFCFML